MAETAVETQAKSQIPGQRFAVALGSWCLAGVGVLSSVMFAGASLAGARSSAKDVLLFLPLVAWVALAVMSVRWVQERHCHWLWPILGTLCGIVSAAMFARVFYFYISAVPLAIYLVVWHLQHNIRGDGAA